MKSLNISVVYKAHKRFNSIYLSDYNVLDRQIGDIASTLYAASPRLRAVMALIPTLEDAMDVHNET